jgi:hypothetical protein
VDSQAFLCPEREAPRGSRTRTSCMASRQAAVTSRVQVGSEGLEPSPRWLRARYAANNTWIPFGPEGVEPSSGPYKEPALTVELRAKRSIGPEGVEPPPYRLKGGYAAFTPRPPITGQAARSGVEPLSPA